MFTPKRNAILASQTPTSSARVTRSQSLKTKNELFSPSMSGSANRSVLNNSSNIFNDAILESYKSSLPIKVHEIISQLKHTSHDQTQLNATLLTNGHVCFINEKKVYIWKIKKSLKNIQCNELTLPVTKSFIRAECISVECHNNRDYVALCVSPEGNIRYWPTIFNEFLSIDGKFDLPNGDECVNLTFISENFYLVATANGNLWSITIDSNDGKIVPFCKQIDSSSGFISSVSRRMTSLIFGGSSQLNKNNQNFKCLMRYAGFNEIYMLIDKNLQKWRINAGDNSLSFVGQINVEKLFGDNYLMQSPDSCRFNLAFHSGSITKNSIYLLAIFEDDGLKFTVGEIDTNKFENRLKSFYILNYNINSLDMQTLFKIHAMDNQHAIFVYNANLLISFTGPTFDMNGETRFNILGDRLLASNFYENDLLFFSLSNGILKTRDNSLKFSLEEESSFQADAANNSYSNTMIVGGNMTTLHDHSNMSMHLGAGQDDTTFNFKANRQSFDLNFSNLVGSDQSLVQALKEAFQYYLRKDERDSEALVEEIMRSAGNERKIDLLVVELSEKLIDDMPAHDPRWAEMNPKGKSMTSNLIISNQLKGKIRLHEYYLTFLKKFNILDKLTYVTYNGRDILTCLALQEHGEKLQVALLIRDELYSKNKDLINSAIEYVTKSREENNKHVYPHDLFYRRVSKIDEIFNSMYQVVNEVIKVNSNDQAINYIIDAITFYNKILKLCRQYRRDKAKIYEQSTIPRVSSQLEFIRWTFLPMKESAKNPSTITLCIKQHKISSDYGLINCNSVEKKSMLFQQLNDLNCLVFDEYETRLESLRANAELKNEFENIRQTYEPLKTRLIETFIKHKEFETAVKLAEQYVDFNTLVMICELRNDMDLLESYLNKFENTKFVEHVIKYFMDKKKLNFLLKNKFLRRKDISDCLDKYHYIAWIKDFKNDQFNRASRILSNLAVNEGEYFMKQKSLLSLSKLSLIANGDYNQAEMDYLNRKLDYLAYIENLPNDVVKKLGLELHQIPVFKPEQLIRIYISYENANEIEFKKAIELLDYLNEDKNVIYSEDQLDELKSEILATSILADDWTEIYDEDYPESKLRDTKFYKTIFLILKSGEKIQSILKLRESLLNHDKLELMNRNQKFSFLVEACLEILSGLEI